MPELIKLSHVLIAGTKDFIQCFDKDFQDFDEARDFAFEELNQLKFISKTDPIAHS